MIFIKEWIQLVLQAPKEEKKPCYDYVDLRRLSFKIVGHSVLSAENWCHVLCHSLALEHLLQSGLCSDQEFRRWFDVILD